MLRFYFTAFATFFLTTQSFAQRAPQYYTENYMPSGQSVLTFSFIGLVLCGVFFLIPKGKNSFSWIIPVLLIGSFLCFLPLIIWVGTILVVGGQLLIITVVLGFVVAAIIRLLTKTKESTHYESKELVTEIESFSSVPKLVKTQTMQEKKFTQIEMSKRAANFVSLKQYDKAIEEYLGKVDFQNEKDIFRSLASVDYYEIAKCYMRLSDYQQAEIYLDKSLSVIKKYSYTVDLDTFLFHQLDIYKMQLEVLKKTGADANLINEMQHKIQTQLWDIKNT